MLAIRRRTTTGAPDAGFSMVEVMVALFILGVVATAALGFTVRALRGSAHVQRAQTAVAVASTAMEQVRAVDPGFRTVAGTRVSNLVVGRAQADVSAQWAAAGTPALTARTTPTWDPSVTTSAPVVPFTTYVTAAGDVQPSASAQTYTVDRLIGTCYRPHADRNAPCGLLPSGATLSAYTQMARVVVRVAWAPGGTGACAASGCTYQLTELIDPNGDPKWRANSDHAVDDAATVAAGDTGSIPVLDNDVLTPQAATSYAATIAVVPPQGNAVAQADGTIAYSAPSTFTGTTAFRYRARNVAGASTDPATVTVTVVPGASDYTVTTPVQTLLSLPVDLRVLDHTTGTGASSTVTITKTPAGSASLAVDGAAAHNGSTGRTVTFTPSLNKAGTYTVKYTATTNGLTSAVATVTIQVVG